MKTETPNARISRRNAASAILPRFFRCAPYAQAFQRFAELSARKSKRKQADQALHPHLTGLNLRENLGHLHGRQAASGMTRGVMDAPKAPMCPRAGRNLGVPTARPLFCRRNRRAPHIRISAFRARIGHRRPLRGTFGNEAQSHELCDSTTANGGQP